MASRPLILAAGALAALGIAAASHAALSPAFMAGLEAQAAAVTEGAVTVDFRTRNGSYSRHPELSGARDLHPDERRRLALAVSALPGVGGPYWRREERRQITQAAAEDPLFCERRIDAILKTRTIRFAEAPAGGTSVLAYDPSGQASRWYRQLAEEVLARPSTAPAGGVRAAA